MALISHRVSLWWRGGALAVLSVAVAAGWVEPLDRLIAAHAATWRSPALNGPMRAVTFFGSSLWGWAALAVAGIWAASARRRRAWVALAAAFGLSFGLEFLLRQSVPHWRPDVAVVPASMGLMTRFQAAGFPSGHGIRSALTFGWLASQLRGSSVPWARAALVGCLLMMLAVGATRVYLNRHWASDILGSWLVVSVAFSITQWNDTRLYA